MTDQIPTITQSKEYKMKTATILTIAALLPTIATAGGPVFTPAPVPPLTQPITPVVSLWDGPYAGLSVAATSGDTPYTYAKSHKWEETVQPDLGGEAYGVYAGYGTTIGWLYLSGEVAWQSYEHGDTVNCHDDCYRCSSSIQDMTTVKGRLGVVSGSVLAYGHLGYNWANVSMGIATPNGRKSDGITGIVEGISYGAGIEIAATDHIRLRVEYTMYDLGGLSGQMFGSQQTTAFAHQSVTAGIHWQF
jgi:opacity protein-like surface antigen